MKSTPLDIDVRLKLCCDQNLPAELITQSMQCVNDAYFASELSDLREIRKTFLQLPQVAFDAAEHRMKKHKRSSVLISAVDKGSIEIVIFVTGLAMWILEKTLGETMKEAWLESDSNKKLKKFLLKGRHKKVKHFREDAHKRLARKIPSEYITSTQVQKQSNNHIKDGGAIITFEVMVSLDEKYPPKRGDLFQD